MGNFSKPLARIIWPKSPTFLGNFCKGVKFLFFLVKSYLGNFNRHLAIFFWSHWPICVTYHRHEKKQIRFYNKAKIRITFLLAAASAPATQTLFESFLVSTKKNTFWLRRKVFFNRVPKIDIAVTIPFKYLIFWFVSFRPLNYSR